MILYHRTSSAKAQAILAGGFSDDVAELDQEQETRQDFAGVWMRATPPPPQPGDNCLLRITLDMTPEELAEYKWEPADRPDQEWLIPAALITAYGKVEVLKKG